MEDISRAGGIPVIMARLHRAGLIHGGCRTVSGDTVDKQLRVNDIHSGGAEVAEEARQRALAAPGGQFCLSGFAQSATYPSVDADVAGGAIRDFDHAYSKDGGLCVLYGNLAQDGCIVKTAGVDAALLRFTGTAKVCDSQEQAVELILGNTVQPGDIVVIRYEGPKGGPGMQEMLYPTSYLKARHIDKQCALITDGRFSGGTSGLSIGHVSPEAAAGGNIGLVENGDVIDIDIPKRTINVRLSKRELAARRRRMLAAGADAFRPKRERRVSEALQAYALMTTSAANGAVRDIAQCAPRARRRRP
ncbi:MAG: Dihydroxy-acid dehydratase [Lentisphaerae bacterium ADurb.BinA184]|nr:MAG: Dihydroxy-acid dehydratase [Lentisphaerae bacterium ADurb.BinA184]